MAWVRISAGRYRNTETGETRNSTTAPKDTSAARRGGGKKKQAKNNKYQKQLNKAQNTNKAGDLARAEETGAQREARQDIVYSNPNQENPFGNRVVTIDPVTGQPTVTDTLSPEQQRILEQQQGLSATGGEKAQAQLENIGQFNPEDFGADRARIEDEVFARLTRGVDEQQSRDVEQVKQSLVDRGIPYSDDPNSRYQQELQDVNQRYDDARTNARRTATEMGGGELSRQFGIGQSTHQQQLSDVGTLSGLGTGLRMPNFQPYESPDYNPANATDIYATVEGNKNQKQQLDIAQQQANRKPSGGGSSAPAEPESDFEKSAAMARSATSNNGDRMYTTQDVRNPVSNQQFRQQMQPRAGLKPGQMNPNGGVAGGPYGSPSSVRPDMSLPNTGYPPSMTGGDPYGQAMDQISQQAGGPPGQMQQGGFGGGFQNPVPSEQDPQMVEQAFTQLEQQAGGPPGQIPGGQISGSAQNMPPVSMPGMQQQQRINPRPQMTRVSPGVYRNERTGNLRPMAAPPRGQVRPQANRAGAPMPPPSGLKPLAQRGRRAMR